MTTPSTDSNASGGSLVLFGVFFVALGVVGVSWSIKGRFFSHPMAGLGNGVAAGVIGLSGIVMIVIGIIQML